MKRMGRPLLRVAERVPRQGNTVSMTVQGTPELVDLLGGLADDLGCSRSAIVRAGVQHLIDSLDRGRWREVMGLIERAHASGDIE